MNKSTRRAIPMLVFGLVVTANTYALAGSGTQRSPDAPGMDDSAVAAEVLQPLWDGPFRHIDSEIEAQDVIEAAGLQVGFPDLWAGLITESEDGRMVIQYDRTGDPSRVAAFERGLAELANAATELAIVGRPVDFNEAELVVQSYRIVDERTSWAARLDVEDIVAVVVDMLAGEIEVHTTSDTQLKTVVTDGANLRIIGSSSVGLNAVSRWNDAKPFSGGAALRTAPLANGAPTCTMGFVWRMAGTNEVMGSTADHCYHRSGATIWYNGALQVGQRYYFDGTSNPNTDTMTLRSNPIGAFNPNIWIGPPNSTQARIWVTGVSIRGLGAAVALTGAVSGQHVGTVTSVIGQIVDWPTGRVIRPLTVTNGTLGTDCNHGDSGGPWFSTPSGKSEALAAGQHIGFINNKCAYMAVNHIASALGASVLLH